MLSEANKGNVVDLKLFKIIKTMILINRQKKANKKMFKLNNNLIF